ncbi:MAG: NADH-quinone oxidoreductase subunit NuoK [Bdellovibrionales bacterium]|nr:NADH-quinone oxidoreductase subunit NuoK [Bdellovibrionales bacterium]
MEIELNHFLIVSLLLFVIGFFGVLARRNLLIILMSIELMLNAVNLSFVSFSQFYNLLSAQVAAFFVMTISAAEAGVGLALIVLISRRWTQMDLFVLEDSKYTDPV